MYNEKEALCSYKEKRQLVLELAEIKATLARLDERCKHLEEGDGKQVSEDRIKAMEAQIDEKVGKGEFAYVRYMMLTFTIAVLLGAGGVLFEFIKNQTS
jgi:hypothetical protein